MTIINYQEFTETFNDLFTNNSIRDIQDFSATALKSKDKRKKAIKHISDEINKLKVSIEKYQYKIKRSSLKSDKKEYGLQLNYLLGAKKDLIKQYNEQRQANAFTTLSFQAKIYACTMALLNKYMTDELCRHNPLGFPQNTSGDIMVPTDFFKGSYLYQSAAHIKDFVASYIENYPERVKGARYFIGLYKNISSLGNLTDEIDSYFEEINKPEQKEQLRIKKSHEGFLPVCVFAEDNVQAVKLFSKTALDYEGSALRHCVGTYALKVENGETEIYSIRDIGDKEHELIPHATIEFKDGTIKQIKGYRDSLVAFEYVNATRKLAMHLLNTEDFNDVLLNKGLAVRDKNNIGIYEDTRGQLHDIFNLCEEEICFDNIMVGGSAISYFPLTKMNIRILSIKGTIPQKNIPLIKAQKNFYRLNLVDCVYDGTVLDLSALETGILYITFKQAPNLRQIILPPKVSEVSVTGELPQLKDIQIPADLLYLQIKGTMPKLETLDVSQAHLKKLAIECEGVSALRTLQLSDDLKELKLAGNMPKLKEIPFSESLEIFNFGITTDADTCMQIMNDVSLLPNLKRLRISGDNIHIKELSCSDKLEYLDIAGNNFPDLEKIDLAQCKALKTIELSNPNMPELTTFILPSSLENLVTCSLYAQKLKELDLSQLDVTHFGHIKPIPLNAMTFGDDSLMLRDTLSARILVEPSMHYGGFTFQCANFSGMEKIKFSPDVETIWLNGLHFEKLGYVDFSEYKRLRKLDMTTAHLGAHTFFDFSGCENLKKIGLEKEMINHVKIPGTVEEVKLYEDNKPKYFDFESFRKLQQKHDSLIELAALMNHKKR